MIKQFLFILLCLFVIETNAQVSYNVSLQENGEYHVTLKSEVDWEGIQKLTSTGQVTLVVPTGGFELSNLQSQNGTWAFNARAVAPQENTGYDYLTVGLVSLGTNAIQYKSDEETLLFTFENTGTCTGSIALMESNDPFSAPNSKHVNVGNQLTTLGSGNQNAWVGNYGAVAANCQEYQGKLDFILRESEDQFIVSIMPDVTWTGSKALTATGQVSIAVPTNTLEIGDITNYNGVWINNASFSAPEESTDTDYFTFGLASLGTDEISYQAGVEEVLFSFSNAGVCFNEIRLVDTADAFFEPNSLNMNVGNQLTTLGSGNRNAWHSNSTQLTRECVNCEGYAMNTCTAPLEELIVCADFCDQDDSFTITEASAELNASISILSANCFRYIPLPSMGANTFDQVTVTACNAQEKCIEVGVTVQVGCTEMNIVAINDFVEVRSGQSINIAVQGNDAISGMPSAEFCMDEGAHPQYGSISLNDNGTITYQAANSFSGQDQFTYTLCGPNGITASATVYVTVASLGENSANEIARLINGSEEEVLTWFNDVQIANIITPNNDGVNDVWSVPNLTALGGTVSVFDRAGNMVYESSKQTPNGDFWTGRLYNNGQQVMAATYFYVLTLEVGSEEQTRTGFVELRR